MSHKAADYDNIIKLFNMYTQERTTRAPSLVGFKAFMLTKQNYPAWMVQQLTQQINRDVDLKFHLNTIIEASIVEGALTGLLKGDAARFMLKNNHGYKDNPQTTVSSAAVTKQIVFKKAEAPKQIDHE